MRDLLSHVWSKQNKTAIACLGLVPLVISCAATDVAEPPADTTASSTPEETVVAAEPTTTQPAQTSSQPKFSGRPQPAPAAKAPTAKAPTAPQPARTPSQTAASNNSQPAPTPAADAQLIAIESGMQYATARARLLEKGWVPAEAPDPGPYGVEREAYDAGYTEVAGCAGTGLGQCRFDFFHPDEQKSLSVTTYGGSRLEVGDWNIQPFSAVVAAAPASSSPVAQTQSTIPTQFVGEWNRNLEECGVSYSTGKLDIETDKIGFYESVSTGLEVIPQGDLKMTVMGEYFGEGAAFTRTHSFELSSDRSTITTNGDPRSARYRCPEGSSAVAAAPANSNPVAQTQTTIPERFHGVWNGASCDGVNDGLLEIGPNRVQIYESIGTVQEVIVIADLEIEVTADYNSEGELYTATRSFKVSSDRSIITRIDEDGFSSQYSRCSG